MEGKEENMTDTSVPHPSLVSTTSRISLEATPTINKLALDDVFINEKLQSDKCNLLVLFSDVM